MVAKARTVDFSGVKDGGNSKINKKRLPAGDFLGKIISVEDADKEDAAMYLFVIQPVKHPSAGYPYYCKLQDNQLWKLRNLFIAAGKNVPKTKQKIDPNVLVGKLVGITLDDTEYDGKEQSEIAGVFPAADLSDDSDDVGDDEEESEEDEDLDLSDDEAEEEAEEEEAEADDEDEEVGDGYDEMDRTELKAAIRESDPTFQAKKSQTDDDLRAILRAGIADEEEEEEEEEEVPEPPKKILKKAAPAAVKKAPIRKKSIDEVTDEELEELDIDEL